MFAFDLSLSAVVVLAAMAVAVAALSKQKPRRRKPTAQIVPLWQNASKRTEPRVTVKKGQRGDPRFHQA